MKKISRICLAAEHITDVQCPVQMCKMCSAGISFITNVEMFLKWYIWKQGIMKSFCIYASNLMPINLLHRCNLASSTELETHLLLVQRGFNVKFLCSNIFYMEIVVTLYVSTTF